MKSESKLNFFHFALIAGLIFNGSLIFYTLENTYDALIHVFFGNHYAISWWDPWEPRWYTGFTVMTYPPLVHQLIGLISLLFGLKMALFIVAILIILLFINGVYRFSFLITSNKEIAGLAALIASFSTVFIETLHVFGQLPTLMGISLLMLSLKPIYYFIRLGKTIDFLKAVSLLAATVCSHHVTPIFGMVFFIFPLIGMAVIDHAYSEFSEDDTSSDSKISLVQFLITLKKLMPRIVLFGSTTLVVLVLFILPYWLISKSDPITQVPIPHGSRDNFLVNIPSGFMFFVVPWGLFLTLLPYFFYRFFSRRLVFFGLSFLLLTILGTGGTTPIPVILLGKNAFNILTLDRFTFWANILCLPIAAEFFYRFFWGEIAQHLKTKYGSAILSTIFYLTVALLISWAMFVVSLGYFRPFQPQKIRIQPLVNFLNQDQHYNWRYLNLGFGDQMAWLSAHTQAETIDGNYHSARRLPELTTRAVERLEGAKYRGTEGIGSLQEILTNYEKYHLKFIFSNDKFYDPLLFFYGWERLTLLENGIWIWQKPDVTPLPKFRSKKESPMYQKVMWGSMSMLSILLVFLFNVIYSWFINSKTKNDRTSLHLVVINYKYNRKLIYFVFLWSILICVFWSFFIMELYFSKKPENSPKNTIIAYYDAFDMKQFDNAFKLLLPIKTFDQYMLETSMEDGLFNSYGKIDGIRVTMLDESETKAKARVSIDWVSPLKKLTTTEEVQLVYVDDAWKIIPQKFDPTIQQNTFFSKPTIEYYSHGKRLIDVEKKNYDDKLQQPVLNIFNVNLVKNGTNYSVVGEIQNIDIFPSSLNVKAELYDDNNYLLATSYSKDVVKHFFNPKEITPFRIDFEPKDWLVEKKLSKDIPSFSNRYIVNKKPVRLVLHGSNVVYYRKIQNDIAIQNCHISDHRIKGTLYNGGIDEVTIPEFLISYFNSNNQLLWVDNCYNDHSIKSQKNRSFSINIPYEKMKNLEIVLNSDTSAYLNGIKNKPLFSNKNMPIIIDSSNKIHSYKIILNNFVGNLR